MDLEQLYLRLPAALQEAVLSLESLRIARRRFDGEFRELLTAARARSHWSAERIEEFRDRRIAELVRGAAESVPHYRELFSSLQIDPREIRSLADLSRLPVLPRSSVRAEPLRLRAQGAHGPAFEAHTSGSTGAGLRFPVTWRAHREQWAIWWRYRGWHGIEPETPCLYFGGRSIVPVSQRKPPFWRRDRAGSRWLFSAYHLDGENARAYLEAMRRSGAQWVHGYPSVVALIASHALEQRIEIPLRWVTLGAENLLPQHEQLIERAFGVKPIEHYGMAEGVANISMCTERRLHVDEDFAATEFLPEADGRCRVIGTNFSNPAFPLLRYDVGDYAVVTGGSCGCGRPGRIVERLDGRLEDYVITRSGAKLGRLDHIFKDMVNVREAQIRQARAGAMTIAIVRGAGWTERDEAELRRAVLQRVGGEMEFDIDYVEAVQRTAAEKLRLVVSTLEQGRISAPRP